MLLFFLSILLITSHVTGQVHLDSASSSAVDLTIQRISRVNSEDDPSGKNHNTKVIISQHQPIYSVSEWKLILQTMAGDSLTLHAIPDGSQPSTQTEIIFKGNLPESKSVFLQATDKGKVVAMNYIGLPVKDLMSTVAWVGDTKGSLSASMRVSVSEHLSKVSIGDLVCSSTESPCYYTPPVHKQSIVERCLTASLGSSKTVQLCDEREIAFKEMTQLPLLYLQKDETMLVRIFPEMNNSRVEVVAYDPVDQRMIYSNPDFNCYISDDQRPTMDGGKISCIHNISLPDRKKELMILVVLIDMDGYVQGSSLQLFKGNMAETDTTKVLVASFIGTMIAIAIIMLLVMFILRIRLTKKRKKREAGRNQSVKYTQTATH